MHSCECNISPNVGWQTYFTERYFSPLDCIFSPLLHPFNSSISILIIFSLLPYDQHLLHQSVVHMSANQAISLVAVPVVISFNLEKAHRNHMCSIAALCSSLISEEQSVGISRCESICFYNIQASFGALP